MAFSFIRPNFKPMSRTRDPRLASAGQEMDAAVPLKRDTCKVGRFSIPEHCSEERTSQETWTCF